MIKTIEILGEERFEEICDLYSLSKEEKAAIKKVLEEWDKTIEEIPDFEKRMEKKYEIFLETVKDMKKSEILRMSDAMLAIMKEFIKKVSIFNDYSKNQRKGEENERIN